MNKIFNWTIGSFFRSIGRILAYVVIGLLIAYVSSKLGLIMTVNAETVSTSGTQFNVYVDSNVSNGCSSGEGQGYKNLDTSVNLTGYQGSVSSTYAVSRVDYYTTANLTAGTTYTLEIMQSFNPKNWDSFHASAWDYYFEGSTTNSTSGLNANNVESYYCYIENINNAYQLKLHCTFIPKVNLKMLYWRTWTNCNATGVSYFNTYTLKIDSVSGVQESINNQTNIINNQTTKIEEQTEIINDINDSINDDNVNESTSELGDFFEDFTTNTHGLTGVITAPLNAINSLTSSTCSPLVLPLPFVNQNLTLPCMRSIYDENFGGFMNLYDIITLGIVSYWVSIRVFNLVKDFKNPDHDEIEVMDL